MDISLYDFQAASVEALRSNFRKGIINQVLSAPTGSGKTIVATYLLKACFDKGTRAVFVADRLALIDQTSAVLDRYDVPHGIIQAQNERALSHAKIQVATVQTLDRRGWPDADLLIVDECHSLHRATSRRILPRETKTIGLTATPFAKGMGLLYDAVVSFTTTNALIESGTLSKYRIFAASQPDMTGAKVRAGEWTEDEAASRSMPIIGDCVAEYLKHGQGKKFIAFGVNVAHCEEMQRQFHAAGVPCALYTYHEGDEERRRMVEEFRKPDSHIRGLLSVSAIAKGFDVSDVGVVILARPLRSSLAEHIQMFGRGLRSHPGKEECIYLDHSGNTVRFWSEMQEFFENGALELDDGKRKESKKQEPKEKKPAKCPTCHCVHKPAPTCPACGHQYERRSTVVHEAGELSEVASRSSTKAEKQVIYSQLLHIARERNYSPGWAAHRYRQRTGVWPRGLNEHPIPPTPDMLNWLRSRVIAFHKAKDRGRR